MHNSVTETAKSDEQDWVLASHLHQCEPMYYNDSFNLRERTTGTNENHSVRLYSRQERVGQLLHQSSQVITKSVHHCSLVRIMEVSRKVKVKWIFLCFK